MNEAVMAKKKTEGLPAWTTVQVREDLKEKIDAVCDAEGVRVHELVDSILRPAVNRMLQKHRQEIEAKLKRLLDG